MMAGNNVYIGDGVYVWFNGWDIILSTDDYKGNPAEIVLEPIVLKNLLQFVSQVTGYAIDYKISDKD